MVVCWFVMMVVVVIVVITSPSAVSVVRTCCSVRGGVCERICCKRCET
jgi:hypothetical protein